MQEYRQYAEECLRSAEEAENEDQRAAFLEMAYVWALASSRLAELELPNLSSERRSP